MSEELQHAEPVRREPSPPVVPPTGDVISVVVIGDSLASGYQDGRSYVDPLIEQLTEKGWPVHVENMGLAGANTTYAHPAAVKALAGHPTPDVVVLELGGNDLGDDPQEIKANLEKAVVELQAHGVEIVLSGMAAPAWYSDEYRQEFDAVYTDLTKQYGLILDPLIVEELIAERDAPTLRGLFNQSGMADPIHPDANGANLIAGDLLEEVEIALNRVQNKHAADDQVVERGKPVEVDSPAAAGPTVDATF